MNKKLKPVPYGEKVRFVRTTLGLTQDEFGELGNTPDVLRKSYLTKSRERIKRDIQTLRGPLVSFG